MYRDVDFAGLPSGDILRVDGHDNESGRVVIPDAQLLFAGKYKKAGPDLVLTGEDGRKLVVVDYYRNANRSDLVSQDGAVLTADVVDSLAGPANPAQYAQAAGAPAGARLIGRVEKVSGATTVQRSNGAVVELKVGDLLYQGDVVQTGQGSSLGLSLVDGSAFNMGANARMVLNEVVYDANSTSNSALVNIVLGSVTFVAGKIAKTGDMKLETPSATLGIRGTVGNILIDANLAQQIFRLTLALIPDQDGTARSLIDVLDKNTGQLLIAYNSYNDKVVVTTSSGDQVQTVTVPLAPGEVAALAAQAQAVFQVQSQALANPLTQQGIPQNAPGQGPHNNTPNPELDQQNQKLLNGPGDNPAGPQPIKHDDNAGPPPVVPASGTNELPAAAIVAPVGGGSSLPPLFNGAPPALIPDSNPFSTPTPSFVPTYDVAAMVAAGWQPLSADPASPLSLVYVRAANYGTVGVNTSTAAIDPAALTGWTALGGGAYSTFVPAFNATVTINVAPGTPTYALDPLKAIPLAANQHVTDTIHVPVVEQGTTVQEAVPFTIIGVNDTPIVTGPVTGTATIGGTAVALNALANAYDFDTGAVLSVVAPQQLSAGVSFNAAAHSFVLDPTDPAVQNLPDGAVVTVQYKVSDGLATTDASVSWTVSGSGNHPPVVTATTPAHLVEAVTGNAGTGTASASLTLSDLDGGASYDIAALLADGWANTASGVYTKTGVYGIAALDTGANTLSYILDNGKADKLGPNDHPTESFVVPVTDGTADAGTTVVFTIDGRNDAPRVGTTPELSFETGLTAWQISGSAVQVTDGTDGVYAVRLTAGFTPASTLETFLGIPLGTLAQINAAPAGSNNPTSGSAIATDIFLEAGQTLTFDWSFATDDYNPYRDFAFFSYAVTGASGALKLSDVFLIGNFGDSGWQSGGFIAPVSGLYHVGFGVSNSGDNAVASYLKVDNVSSGAGQALGVTEDASASGTETAVETIHFSDPEAANTHALSGPTFVSTDYAGGVALGALALVLASDTVNGLGGAITATYHVDDSAIQFLAEGQVIHETYAFTLNDGTTTSTQSVTITITGTNDAPAVSGAVTGAADAGGPPVALNALLNATDVDAGTTLSAVIPAQLPPGVSYDAQTHTFTLDPSDPAYANNPDPQTVTVDYAVTDGLAATAASVSWTVSGGGPANQAPTTADTSASGAEDTAIAITLSGSDADGTVASFTIADLPANGTLYTGAGLNDSIDTGESIFANGNGAATVYFKPNANWNGDTNFAYAAIDDDGLADATPATASITVTPVNDAPVFTSPSGSITAGITEGSHQAVTGQVTVADAEMDGVVLTIAGGGAPNPASYAFAIDDFKITRTATNDANAPVIFHDGFDDGLPPPDRTQATGATSATYATTGSFGEQNGYAVFDAGHAVPVGAAASPGALIGEGALLRTDNSTSPAGGLKYENDFTLQGTFVLDTPQLGQQYGISLNDGATGGTDDDHLQLVVRKLFSGGITVRLQTHDPATDTLTPIDAVLLQPPQGATEITLRLMHAANAAAVTAEFDYLGANGTVLQTVSVGASDIFHGENFTQAAFQASAPQTALSYVTGTYGTLSINQQGVWTYGLNNFLPAVQNLGDGEQVTDSFDLQVTDSNAASSLIPVVITVTGTGPGNNAFAAAAPLGLTVGGDGADIISGGAGDDMLTGGAGNDVFAFKPGGGHDTITDFTPGSDIIDLSAFKLSEADLANLIATSSGNTLTVDIVGDSIVFANIADVHALTPANFAR